MEGTESAVEPRLAWIVGDTYQPPMSLDQMRAVGPLWGTALSWRALKTDNVVVTSYDQAQPLVQRAFQAVCNLYVPSPLYAALGHPTGVRVFEGAVPGEFALHALATVFHLVPTVADTILVAGVSFVEPDQHADPVSQRKFLHSFQLLVEHYANATWVILDHEGEAAVTVQEMNTVFFDTADSVITLA